NNADNLAMYRGRFGAELRFTNGTGISSNTSVQFLNLLFTSDGAPTGRNALFDFSNGDLGLTNVVVHGMASSGIHLAACQCGFNGVIVSGNGATGVVFNSNTVCGYSNLIAASNGSTGVSVTTSQVVNNGPNNFGARGNGGPGVVVQELSYFSALGSS